MPRVLLSLLLLASLAAPAAAQSGPQMSGDPLIDGLWAALLRRPATARVAPAAPVRRAAPAMFAPAKPRAKARVQAPPPPRTIDPAFLPSVVPDPTGEPAGTIVIDTRSRYLYLVQDNGMAQRYGVGVGREGFGWTGTVKVGRKAEWPTWTPPAAMRKRQPYLPVSMPGGPNNPLGARALYLYDGGRDTHYRIHGSNEPWTIGHSVSSGCFRMRNEDVVELYQRVGIGTRVVVR
jgi:lipoprotein-anchoring transpeptidase ErfK/SrfK